MSFTIRQEKPGDLPGILGLVEAAFRNIEESDHQEHHLVERLHHSQTFIPELSIVAENEDGKLIGYILLTEVEIASGGTSVTSLALAPLAVLPGFHGMGVGGKLIEEAHKAAAASGYGTVAVLGHKDYYPRFGYRKASDCGIQFPFDAPEECCMVIGLTPDALDRTKGLIHYPDCF